MKPERGRKTPFFIYGTAWKEERTAKLVEKALLSGFRAIDTANQPKHYQEALVGEALAALAKRGIPRGDLFLQTKFTPLDGHDHRCPYNPQGSLTRQVEESFQSSLTHLQTDYLDSYLLHGPYSYPGLGEEDWEVWNTMEELYQSGKVKSIGISNVNRSQAELLCERAKIKPMVVQNRCFANQGWDREVRDFCKANAISYQAFSLLTANPFVWQNPKVGAIAAQYGKTPMQVLFRFAIQTGMVPLTGTTDPKHMREDLQILDFELEKDKADFIEAIAL